MGNTFLGHKVGVVWPFYLHYCILHNFDTIVQIKICPQMDKCKNTWQNTQNIFYQCCHGW